MTSSDRPPNERLQWANLCRVVAIYGVVLIHSCGAAFYQFGAIPRVDWLSANFLDSVVRCAVPLFVMLSGALILPRLSATDQDGRSYARVWQRIAKVLFPLATWSAIYLIYVSEKSGQPVEWLSVFVRPAMYHLWFIYMIIGLYLLIPMFLILFQAIQASRSFGLYLLCFWLLVNCTPIYWSPSEPLLSLLQQSSFLGYGAYFLLGAVVASSRRDTLPTYLWLALFILGVLVTFFLTWSLSRTAGRPVEIAYSYFSPNVFLCSVAAFVLFTRAKVPARIAGALERLGELSFIVFFSHVLVLEYVRYNPFIEELGQKLPMLLTILMISLLTFGISLVISTLIRLVPGARRVLG